MEAPKKIRITTSVENGAGGQYGVWSTRECDGVEYIRADLAGPANEPKCPREADTCGNLEEEFKLWERCHLSILPLSDTGVTRYLLRECAMYFAEWQKEQMLNSSVVGVIFARSDEHGKWVISGPCQVGDEVKILLK